jgi:hypothetical protein
MKHAVFWDVALCRFNINRCFGVTCGLHLQGKTSSSETSVYINPALLHISEDGILNISFNFSEYIFLHFSSPAHVLQIVSVTLHDELFLISTKILY